MVIYMYQSIYTVYLPTYIIQAEFSLQRAARSTKVVRTRRRILRSVRHVAFGLRLSFLVTLRFYHLLLDTVNSISLLQHLFA